MPRKTGWAGDEADQGLDEGSSTPRRLDDPAVTGYSTPTRVFRVFCAAKNGDELFARPLKAATEKQAIKLGRAYARKKGIDSKGCKFQATEQK